VLSPHSAVVVWHILTRLEDAHAQPGSGTRHVTTVQPVNRRLEPCRRRYQVGCYSSSTLVLDRLYSCFAVLVGRHAC